MSGWARGKRQPRQKSLTVHLFCLLDSDLLCDVRFQELRLICALQEDPLQRDRELAPSPELIRDLVTHSTKERAMGQSIRQDKGKSLLSATRH